MKKTRHSIDSFGISKVSLSSIRIEKLEVRVKPKVPFPHKHDFYQLILITAGSGEHAIDFKNYKVSKHQFYLLKPGQIHSWSMSSTIRGWVIEFNHNSIHTESNSPNLIGQLDYTPDLITLKKNEHGLILNITELMQTEFLANHELSDISLRSLLSTLLVQVIKLTGIKKSEKIQGEGLLEKFKSLVEEKFKQEHRVEFYADALGVTPKALTMQITRALGRAPRLIIQDRFILEAKRYLAYSELAIADVGAEIGFEDANYFSRFFKLHEKMTPAQFRIKATTRR